MNYINDIWNYIHPMIDWVVFILVIASGYFIRAFKKSKQNKILKILIFSTFVTGLYALSVGMQPGMYVASYFLAFGFHGAFLKILEKLLTKATRIGGELPKDDDEKN